MNELFPITLGLGAGFLLGLLRPSLSLVSAAPLFVGLGFLATLVTGELRESWAFVLIDVAIVAFCASIGWVTAKAFRRVPG